MNVSQKQVSLQEKEAPEPVQAPEPLSNSNQAPLDKEIESQESGGKLSSYLYK